MQSSPLAPLRGLALAALVTESTAVQALASFAVLALPAVAPAVAAALGLSPALIGLQISVVYIGAMSTSLAAGGWVRRLGAVRTSQIALLLGAAGAGAAMMGTVPGMALGSLLIGLAYGMVNPAASHLLIRATHAGNRNLVFSIKQTGVPIGGTLAGLVAPRLAVAFSWEAAMAVIAVANVALALALQPKRGKWDGDRDPAHPLASDLLAGIVQVWRMPVVRTLSLCGFGYAAVQLCLATFCVTLLVTELGWSLVQAGLVLAVAQIAGAVGRIIWGALADRLDDGVATLQLVGGVTVLGAVGTALMTPAWPVWAVVLVLAVFGIAAIGWNGVYLASVAKAAPLDQVGRVTGLSLFFTFGGVLTGPPTFAALHHALGNWTAAFATLAVPALAGMAMLLRIRKEN